jgi:hypothetical protein
MSISLRIESREGGRATITSNVRRRRERVPGRWVAKTSQREEGEREAGRRGSVAVQRVSEVGDTDGLVLSREWHGSGEKRWYGVGASTA